MTDAISTSAAATSAAGRIDTGRTRLADSYETFMALLTTQLKNQDPTSPLDTNQFTQQLVQMTGVEQQLLTNDLLKSLAAASTGGITAAVGYIGKTVTAEGATTTLSGGEARWSYTLPRAADAVTLEVLNASGQVVRRVTGETGAGPHAFTWDGETATGGRAPENTSYTLRVAATDGNGAALQASVSTTGVVRAIEQADGETVLVLNGARTPLSTVLAVSETAA